VKGAKLMVFQESGHVLNLDQPAKFDSALVGFLWYTASP
jgi:pimeloyl-ACP methyl ester carboxylesterase